jgi:hypothetical protein
MHGCLPPFDFRGEVHKHTDTFHSLVDITEKISSVQAGRLFHGVALTVEAV